MRRLFAYRSIRKAPCRASVLVAESHAGDPLANGRVTLVGTCAPVAAAVRAQAVQAYLARYPDASYDDGFKDFACWDLEVTGSRSIQAQGAI
jgi:hypothetical protein